MTFTPEQIAALAAKLAGTAVKSRKQAGCNVSYIEGWHAIAEANRIFGFDGWDRETVECKLVAEKACRIGAGTDYEKDGWRVGYIAKVRIRVIANGSVIQRDGMGYGSGIDADAGAAHESAIKEAETDAMKRALMTFGNPFGLALYDKTQADVERQPPAAPPAKTPPAKTYADAKPPAPSQTKPAPLPNGAPMDLDAAKVLAGEIVSGIKRADTLDRLDAYMDMSMRDRQKLPSATQQYIAGIYTRCRNAMEGVI